MEYRKAKIEEIQNIYEIVKTTIRQIYPKYYLPEIVDAFCDFHSKENISKDNTIERKKGMVTIDNEIFKRYQGEVCVMLEDLEADERVNVVGEALCSEEYLKMIFETLNGINAGTIVGSGSDYSKTNIKKYIDYISKIA